VSERRAEERGHRLVCVNQSGGSALRILIVNTGFLPVPPEKGGSIELHTYHLANGLAKLGNEVHYVTSVNPQASFEKGVFLHKIPWIPFNFHGNYLETLSSFAVGGFLSFLNSVEGVNNFKFDIIHVHGHIPALLLLPLRKRATFVFTVHNPNAWMVISSSYLKQVFRQLIFKSVELRIIRDSDCVITVGEGLRDELIDRFKVHRGKISVIPNGVDTDFFKPRIAGSEAVLRRYNLPKEYALFVGRLVEQKCVHYMLEATKGTRIHFVIVGEGPLLSHLKKTCEQLEITEQVHFIGAVPMDDLRRIYCQAKLFVLPSVAEGLPLVALEAMACGLPIIASRIPGITNVVSDGHNGFLFDVGDVEQLRHRLVQVFSDSSLTAKMGECSRQLAEDQFSWFSIARRTLKLYQSLLRND
jgi:glycosyltransferase involved in cell wall biosynthesis